MNRIVLKGNLTRDPEIRQVMANGKETCVANFTLAVSRYFTRANKEKDKETTFIPCEAWDTGAKTMGEILHKGDPVLLEGFIKSDNWEKDGQKFSRLKVRVSNFDKLYRAPKNNGEIVSDDSPDEQEQEEVADGEDIPF